MKKNVRKTLIGALLAVAFTPLAVHASALEEVDASEKLVRIRPADNAPASASADQSRLNVDLGTEKDTYRVNEPILFRVRANKQVFLYLFNVVPGVGKAVSILPNRLQTNREIKYAGDNQWRLVPNPGLEFFSDRPGVERIIMVASERYLDVERLRSFGGSKSVGDFFEIGTPLDAFDSLINEAYSDDEGIQQKRIGIRESGSRLPRGVVVKEMNLRIR